MGSMGAGADGIEGGTIEAEEEVECLLSELWCEVVGVVAVGVGGSDSRSSDWELSFLACNESLSFFFFLRNPRVGMRKIAGNILRGEGSRWWPPPIPFCLFRAGCFRLGGRSQKTWIKDCGKVAMAAAENIIV